MHIRTLSKIHPVNASLRDTLEIFILFMDAIGAALGVLGKAEPEDHEDEHDHAH